MAISEISTLDAANLTYEFENVRVKQSNEFQTKDDLVKLVKDRKPIPSNLQYLDDFHEPNTGTSGTAFLDKKTGEVIIAYTGTNPNADLWHDIMADGYSIAMGGGYHYGPAYAFYEKVQKKYGNNITLTGHSLGGNIAQRVALEYNVQNTVVYNAAPLNVPAGAAIRPLSTVVNALTDILISDKLVSTNNDTLKKTATFTGQVTRIRTEGDPLNNISRPVGGLYIGSDYVLKNSGGHGIDPEITGNGDLKEQVKTILEVTEPKKVSQLEKKNTESLQKIQRANLTVSKLVDKFSADGSLSSNEMFYLDSLQATALAASLTETVQNGADEIATTAQKAVEEAEKAYNKSKEIPWFVTELSSDEVQATYAEAGVTYNSIVTKTKEHFDKKTSNMASIVSTFTNLEGQIKAGIEQAVAADARLAEDINQWTSST
ncbi:Mbeg1-like protein [Streptococcus oricebi]|uniref:DUF2974 domain-containing protein n=1 Tax=Streptococcus oricebi TaxID=1547447 RepID=A0ABS5B475_9STRE|nr:Mbeg1-like protein [Streptococcus oricebi]MBP2623496.1 hypothetical protein [Streptococcus oricebi]